MLDDVIKIAKEAGSVLMSYYTQNNSKPIDLMNKDNSFDVVSLVTQADLESEKLIISSLENLFPTHNIYGEESGMKDNDSEYTWYVDPLDGTSNFTRNIPLFGISIGLVKNTESVLGVLYFPALDELVYAEKGKGAFFNDKKISVSKRPTNQAMYYAGGFYKRRTSLNMDIGKNVGITKMLDSSSYELAQIAKGDAEIYELVSVNHDVVAGACIIREASGKVTDYQGKPWTSKSQTILATNGVVHEDVLKIFKGEFYAESDNN